MNTFDIKCVSSIEKKSKDGSKVFYLASFILPDGSILVDQFMNKPIKAGEIVKASITSDYETHRYMRLVIQ